MTDPGSPSDNTTLTEVLDDYEADGFEGQFEITDSSTITCVSCGRGNDPADFTIHARRRLEGASDPDDMISVVAVSCPQCGSRGVLVLGFGPNASEVDSGVGRKLSETNIGGESMSGQGGPT